MKKFNPEYDIPKLRNIFKAVTIIVWVLVHAFQWRTVYFVTEIMVGLVCVSSAVPEWKEKKRGSAIFLYVIAVAWFALAVRSFLRFNI